MGIAQTVTQQQGGATPVRRVRHQARDAVALMLFSAAASAGVAGGFFLFLALLARQA
jgi:hypothetical protein